MGRGALCGAPKVGEGGALWGDKCASNYFFQWSFRLGISAVGSLRCVLSIRLGSWGRLSWEAATVHRGGAHGVKASLKWGAHVAPEAVSSWELSNGVGTS